jgi:uncharacterized protein (TIGR03000 family)
MKSRSVFAMMSALAVATVLFVSQVSEAQIGFHVGSGGHGGGTRWGVSVGQPYGWGYGYGGYGSNGGFYGANFGYPYGYGYPYGGYSYGYPYGYGSYGYASPYYVDSGYYQPSYSYMPTTNYQQSFYPPTYSDGQTNNGQMNQQTPNSASIEVIVPPQAQLWFDGTQTQQTGPVRMFTTPALPEGRASSYQVKATWTDQTGAPVTRSRTVHVAPNQHTVVNFMNATGDTNNTNTNNPNINPNDNKFNPSGGTISK